MSRTAGSLRSRDFVVRSRLDTEKVQALLQEVTELEREVARAHARPAGAIKVTDGGG